MSEGALAMSNLRDTTLDNAYQAFFAVGGVPHPKHFYAEVRLLELGLRWWQQVRIMYEIQPGGTGIWYTVAGRAQGFLDVALTRGPRAQMAAYHRDFSEVCGQRVRTIELAKDDFEAGHASHFARGCALTQVQTSVNTETLGWDANSRLIFADLATS